MRFFVRGNFVAVMAKQSPKGSNRSSWYACGEIVALALSCHPEVISLVSPDPKFD